MRADAANAKITAAAFKLNDGHAGGFGVGFAVGKLRELPTFGHSGGGALAHNQ